MATVPTLPASHNKQCHITFQDKNFLAHNFLIHSADFRCFEFDMMWSYNRIPEEQTASFFRVSVCYEGGYQTYRRRTGDDTRSGPIEAEKGRFFTTTERALMP
jgi:hypothetical protein